MWLWGEVWPSEETGGCGYGLGHGHRRRQEGVLVGWGGGCGHRIGTQKTSCSLG